MATIHVPFSRRFRNSMELGLGTVQWPPLSLHTQRFPNFAGSNLAVLWPLEEHCNDAAGGVSFAWVPCMSCRPMDAQQADTGPGPPDASQDGL